MNMIKRIFALLLVIGLLGLYGLTVFFAITDNSDTMQYLQASLVATVIIPALLWIYSFIYRTLGKGKNKDNEDDKNSQE